MYHSTNGYCQRTPKYQEFITPVTVLLTLWDRNLYMYFKKKKLN